MAVALEAHDGLLRTAVEGAGGTVVKTTGDGLLAAFDRPESALNAAIEGQRALDLQEWQMALAEVEAALGEEFEPTDQAGLLGAACAVRAMRGEPVADDLDEIRRLIGESGDPQVQANEWTAAAFAAFAAGDLDGARKSWHRAVKLVVGAVSSSLPRAARTALWAGNAAAARDDLAALDESGFHGPAVEADRRTIQAGLAALNGRGAEALPLYREALRSWRDLGLAWDEALCGLDMVLFLDPAEPDVRAAAEAAREIFVGLEAAPFIARLDAASARPPDRAGQSASLEKVASAAPG